MRLEFAQKFFLYQGLARYYARDKETDEVANKKYQVTTQSMDLYERDLMQIFDCDPEWPLCLFDFTFKNKTPTYTCLRVEKNLQMYCMDQYFYGMLSEIQTKQTKYCLNQSDESRSELLLERQPHICCENENFVPNFKARYRAKDKSLFNHPSLTMFLENDLQIN